MQDNTKASNEQETKEIDTEFAEELTGEEHAVKKVQNALFEMYAQAGYHDKEKE
ncbi:hypothetical protein MK805_01400 [Shimazuella sp. AN120528]|uniref:hypothetical protein n=1 Tax=Shimazuella soli TaxID=1892854 RepID=UPI001F0EBB16|nr:hypothetical protein [Shimazuella soli]MCH5583627.1 hypothetical protein [Shimazuella soli]